MLSLFSEKHFVTRQDKRFVYSYGTECYVRISNQKPCSVLIKTEFTVQIVNVKGSVNVF